MAKNWTMGEAAHAVRNGDKEATIDIGRRFPLTAVLLAQLNEAGITLCDSLPAYVTARKVEAVIKGDANVADDVAEEEVEEVEIPAPKKAGKEKVEKEEKKAPKKAAKKTVVEEDEDEEEEEPALKKGKKADKKPVAKKEEKKSATKKPAKKVVEEDEDDDDDFDDFDFDDDDE